MGFAIKKDIVTKLTEMPRPVSDRIMMMRLPLSKDNYATIISVYAPTMTNPDDSKEGNEGRGAAEICRQKRHEGLLQWTEGSVGTREKGTCSPEIN